MWSSSSLLWNRRSASSDYIASMSHNNSLFSNSLLSLFDRSLCVTICSHTVWACMSSQPPFALISSVWAHLTLGHKCCSIFFASACLFLMTEDIEKLQSPPCVVPSLLFVLSLFIKPDSKERCVELNYFDFQEPYALSLRSRLRCLRSDDLEVVIYHDLCSILAFILSIRFSRHLPRCPDSLNDQMLTSSPCPCPSFS